MNAVERRGFAVEEKTAFRRRLVVTAAHCLPAIAAAPDGAEILAALLGRLGAEASVWAECLFVDPIADIAVLGSPDDQSLFDEAAAYQTLLGSCKPLKISGGAIGWDRPSAASLLALDGHSIGCVVRRLGGPLLIESLAEPIAGGMSGSPVLDPSGVAIGVVCRGVELDEIARGGVAAHLMTSLPGQLLLSLACLRSLNAERRALLPQLRDDRRGRRLRPLVRRRGDQGA